MFVFADLAHALRPMHRGVSTRWWFRAGACDSARCCF